MGKRKPTKARLRAMASATAIPPAPELDRVVTEAEAAKILGYSKDTLRRPAVRRLVFGCRQCASATA
jgi:hypothetical protein